MRVTWFCVVALCGMVSAQSEPTWKTVTFTLQPHTTETLAWKVSVDRNGGGSYQALGLEGSPVVALTVSEETLQRIGSGQTAVTTGACETRQKNIAKTGRKTVTYETGPGSAACTFNFSDDEKLMDVSAAFRAMVATLQFGERLQRERRFDRLSLDAELQSLTAEVQAGRAIELQNIAPALQSLVDDDRVIDRVRRAAARLMEERATQQ